MNTFSTEKLSRYLYFLMKLVSKRQFPLILISRKSSLFVKFAISNKLYYSDFYNFSPETEKTFFLIPPH